MGGHRNRPLLREKQCTSVDYQAMLIANLHANIASVLMMVWWR